MAIGYVFHEIQALRFVIYDAPDVEDADEVNVETLKVIGEVVRCLTLVRTVARGSHCRLARNAPWRISSPRALRRSQRKFGTSMNSYVKYQD